TTVKPIKIDVFASWLQRAKARFIYLSSCKSAGHDFIYHLAKEGVPAILGFLWKVEDERAHEFADKFYQFLFDDPLSLEHACFKARTEMHKEREDSSIWASPVLVMQVAV